jgi:hypothetical protein
VRSRQDHAKTALISRLSAPAFPAREKVHQGNRVMSNMETTEGLDHAITSGRPAVLSRLRRFFGGLAGELVAEFLLDRLADDAEGAARPVVRVDGRTVGPSQHGFTVQAEAAITRGGVVLIVDNFDKCLELGNDAPVRGRP